MFVQETSIHCTKPILNSVQTLPTSSLFGCVPIEVGNVGMHIVHNAILGIFLDICSHPLTLLFFLLI